MPSKDKDDPPPPKTDIMLQTALRLGLRDIEGVQDYEIEKEDARMVQFREERAKYLAEKRKKEKEAEEEEIRSWGGLGGKKGRRRAIWEDDPDIPMTAAFLKDLSFAEMAKTPQGIRMTTACLLHYDEVRRNSKLKAKIRAYMEERLQEIHGEIYGPIAPLLTLNKIVVRRLPVQLTSHGGEASDDLRPKTRLIGISTFAPDDERLFDGIPTKTRKSACGGLCGSKVPAEFTLTSADTDPDYENYENTSVLKIICSHWNGKLPEWIDIMMPETDQFATIHSSAQMHPEVENNYDIFDNEGRVLGVASPEKVPFSDTINVTLYEQSGSAVTPRIRRTEYEHGEYVMDEILDLSPDLKIVGVSLMHFLLMEDLAGYVGRGKNGR